MGPNGNKNPIPLIDFSNWYNEPSPTSRLETASDLVSACRDVGFVYITNHGISQTLLDQAFAHSRNLFSLPHEQKMLAPHPPGYDVHRGYSWPGLEKVSQYAGGDEAEGEKLREVRDCKESFEIGSEAFEEQPNLWLPENVLPGFRDFMVDFYWECHKLAQEILRAIAVGLGIKDPDSLLKPHSGLNNQLRLLHYPPIPASEIESGEAARMPAHSDWSSITMLFQDDCGGLEVEDPQATGRFVPATPVPGAVVVNVGDLLMRWSNGENQSLEPRQ